ncbi:hypothetical protein R80B4_00080 [Fibrobacteres bacterium R8-0-B4]
MENAEKTVVLDYDIDDVLRISAARATDAYWLGRKEERVEILGEHLTEIVNKTALPSEMFYYYLQKTVGKENIRQHRIGVDYSTGEPTVLAVISGDVADKLWDVRDMARNLELRLFEERGWDCNFWTITDTNIEQSLVNQDFPYRRREIP